MKNCFITGATGHIGNVLVKKLLEAGNKVTVLCLPNEDIEPLKGLKLNIVCGDITDRKCMMSNIKRGQYVYHLAAIISIDDGDQAEYERMKKINVDGTKNVVDACIKNHAKKLIYVSSVHIIEPKKGAVLSEPTKIDETKLLGNYSKTKALSTKYVMEKAKQGLVDATVVYPSGVIGPFDYKISEIGQVILDYLNGKLKGYVRGGYNFIDLRDAVDAIIRASEVGKSGEGYILSGSVCSIKEMILCLNHVLKRKRLPSKFSVFALKLFAKLSNLYYKIRGKKPIFSQFTLETLNSNCNFTNHKAVTELGLKTRNILRSFKDSIDWFILNKKELINFKKIKNYTPSKNITLK